MAFSTRQITLQAPTTNTTQDFEVSGFGTPDAAIIMWSSGGDGAWSNDANIGIGFWDGSNQRCVTAGYDHGDVFDSGSGRQAWDPANVVWFIINGSSPNERKASITSTLTNGVRLTWTGNQTNARPYVTVILLKGLNGAQTGFRTSSDQNAATTQTFTSGMTPKLILFAGRLSDSDTAATGSTPRLYLGFACQNGSLIDNYSVGWRQRHDTDPTDMNGQVVNDACIPFDVGITGIIQNYATVTEITSGSFTTTSTVGGTVFASSQHYLALDFDEDVVGFSSGTPTSSGDWTVNSPGFIPQWMFTYPTGFAALNTTYSNDEDGIESHHIYSVNTSGEEDGHTAIVENGAGTGQTSTTMYAQSRYDSSLRIARVTSGGGSQEDLITGNSPTFDSSGVTFADANFSHDTGQTHQVIGFMVEEAQAPITGNPMMMRMLHEGNLR